MHSVTASVPGKLILMGEHAAVYGKPAMVATVGLRARAELEPTDAGVVLEMPDLGHHETIAHGRLGDLAVKAREAWERYAADPRPDRFAALRSDDAGQLVRLAVGETLMDLGLAGDLDEAPPFRLRVSSEIPIGAGFGSSAALSVGIVAAVLAAFEGKAPLDRVDRLALEVERRQHGLPSGVDHGAVLRGGVVWAERDEAGELHLEDLELGNDLLSRLAVFHTGEPESTTGAVVAAVRESRREDPETFDLRLGRMDACVRSLRRLLVAPRADTQVAAELIKTYQRCLEELGVVPSQVAAAIGSMERRGVAAKISGAGALDGPGAGCLLVLAPETAGRIPEIEHYTPYPVELGSQGLELEIHS